MSSTSISLTPSSTALKTSNNSLTLNSRSNRVVAPSGAAHPVRSSATTPIKNAPLARPQTPQTPQTPQSNTPGTWRHPRIDDIARRQSAAAFTSENFRSAAKYSLLLSLAVLCPNLGPNLCPSFITAPIAPYRPYAILLIRLYFLAGLLWALKPLVTKPDEMADIPLTPAQRRLLGLKPSATPITPSSVITPPRYSRSGTPKSGGTGGRSPFEASPLDGRRRSGSFGAGARERERESPLMQKALERRRESLDLASLGLGSGSPLGAGKASVGLNSKWLYEKGRGSPTGRGLFS